MLGAEVALEVDGTDEVQLSPAGLPAQGNNFKGGQLKNEKRKNKNKKLPTARLHRISHAHHASICGDLGGTRQKQVAKCPHSFCIKIIFFLVHCCPSSVDCFQSIGVVSDLNIFV